MSRIYFIKSARSNAIKIGVATDPRERLGNMQTGSIARLSIVAEMPGDERYEKILHAQFAEHRIRGEWFRCEGQLATFVSMLPAMYALHERVPRVRQSKPDSKPDRELIKYIERIVYPLIREIIFDFGVREFAELAATKPHIIRRAVWNQGYRIPIEWAMWAGVIASPDRKLELANAILRPLGFRALTKQQAAAEREAEARLVLLKAAVVRAIGEEDARKFFDSIGDGDEPDPPGCSSPL